ncbi:hypothetical protein SAMN04488136_11972 [Vibrio xiamenensis]|uniref:5-bromo-4-chloroindolyl phosphate hydrolysis protein n=1 Tax=Vibrio xiamenensis TaxID=861298 RepID=A0A1G8DD49_9VIBR|nr:hypothetical protein [Vibrio xiamenensis]SDH55652.1 hypothetical protein SAMN04488136_11972 [Vibrio xiamenensis]
MANLASNPLSERDLKQRLRKETINHPLTLSTFVVGALAGLAAFLFAQYDGVAFLLVAAIFSLLVCGGFTLYRNVIGRHKSMLALIEKVRQETCSRRVQIETSVHDGLSEFKEHQALHQLGQLKDKFSAFTTVLNLQFDSDEMAHKRYLTTAEQLYFSAVDNLRRFMVLRHSINAIDVKHIRQQLKNGESLDQSTRDALTKRLDIYQDAQYDMLHLLSINEQAMTKLDDVSSNLGSIQTREGLGTIGLEHAMQEIHTLISRAEKYDISNQKG